MVDRYNVQHDPRFPDMEIDYQNGDYVKHSDYAKLEADIANYVQHNADLATENQRLRDALKNICRHMKISSKGMYECSAVYNIAKQALEEVSND